MGMKWWELLRGSMVTDGVRDTVTPLEESEAGLGTRTQTSQGVHHLKDCNNDAKEANGTAKDLHDENLYKEAGVLCISQGSSTAHDAHADSTEEVRQAHCEASSKHGVACEDGREY